MCQGYAALLLTGNILLQCLSAAVYLHVYSAVKVQSSLQSTDLKDFFFSDAQGCDKKKLLKHLSKTELRDFVYFSQVGESLQ